MHKNSATQTILDKRSAQKKMNGSKEIQAPPARQALKHDARRLTGERQKKSPQPKLRA